jgi:hypothetical protein
MFRASPQLWIAMEIRDDILGENASRLFVWEEKI